MAYVLQRAGRIALVTTRFADATCGTIRLSPHVASLHPLVASMSHAGLGTLRWSLPFSAEQSRDLANRNAGRSFGFGDQITDPMHRGPLDVTFPGAAPYLESGTNQAPSPTVSIRRLWSNADVYAWLNSRARSGQPSV
jgi:hypothetical protein